MNPIYFQACDVATSLRCPVYVLSYFPLADTVQLFSGASSPSQILKAIDTNSTYMGYNWGDASRCLFMKATNAELKSMYAHKRRFICQTGRANYLIRCDIVCKPCISFCNIKNMWPRPRKWFP